MNHSWKGIVLHLLCKKSCPLRTAHSFFIICYNCYLQVLGSLIASILLLIVVPKQHRAQLGVTTPGIHVSPENGKILLHTELRKPGRVISISNSISNFLLKKNISLKHPQDCLIYLLLHMQIHRKITLPGFRTEHNLLGRLASKSFTYDTSSIIWRWHQINILDFVTHFRVQNLFKSKRLWSKPEEVGFCV